ncbi:hypothetical protein COLO4_13335 [Corchorus olitorius]|uniref:Uncharacterized protein n=1 Tax=Corchorus olitorius TaxID=93759 RepID=A0A1R3JXD6_9ROSI|nr:hypothetical protein COLO4_13335 [Corchorus olitorius]
MDSSLWTFLVNSPDRAVPWPWERVIDLQTEVLFYRNDLSQSLVFDLRNRVNLGGGMFYENPDWKEMARIGLYSRYLHIYNRYDQDHPFVIQANCCFGPFVFLIVPFPVWTCPVCDYPFPTFF